MTLNLAISVVVVLCGLCLTASIAICIRAQELHTQSLELFGLVYDWIEQNRHQQEVIITHEGTE